MTAPSSVHLLKTRSQAAAERVIDLEGSAIHVFQFAAPLPLAYDYFADIPAIFELLPDTLDIQPYTTDNYRLIVGASDHHGHSMAAVFDLLVEYEADNYIRLSPADDGPDIQLKGLTFRGELWAKAAFKPTRKGTVVEYSISLGMSIPLPKPLQLMPQSFLQSVGERAMTYKVSRMITGFARDVEADFARWISGS